MKTSLGYKRSDREGLYPMAISDGGSKDKKEEPTLYPELVISGKAAKSLIGKVKTGETITLEVTLRVSEVADRQEGKYDGGARVEFEVQDMDIPDMNSEEDDEESAEEAVDKFRSSKPDEDEID